MIKKIIVSSIAVACLTTGCENPKQALGTVGGGALGAWAGSTIGKGRGQVVAAAVGGVAGALAGSYIGGQLDQKDRMQADRTYQRALESSPMGQTAQWRNPDSGNCGTITPVKTYQNPQGQHCREFQQTIIVGGRQEQAYGTACRQPDGHWKMM